MTGVPAVSVIMAAWNAQAFLDPALRSVLDQTFRDLEIVVVDDASTDATPAILARLAAEDARLRVARQAANSGAGATRNRAIALARAPLVAVMDADDIAPPGRIAIQKAFMDAHPGVVMAGGSLRQIDGAGRVFRTSLRARDAVAVRWFARFNMPLSHPTVMFRRDPGGVPLHYDATLPVAQDYDMVARALDRGAVVSLPDILVDYRVHGASLTGTRWRDQQAAAGRIALARQAADLPADVVAALAPFRSAYFLGEPVPPAAVFAGLRAMLAQDVRAHPGHAAWFRRQAAQLALEALGRMGLGRGAAAAAFVRHGAGFIAPLGLRAGEVGRLLPGPLRSDRAQLAALAIPAAAASAAAGPAARP